MDILRGHNSASFGQELVDDVETVLSDEHEKLFHFAKWHIEDYILGTQGMKLEIEGAYMRFLMRLYQRGKPLPDDDNFMSVIMGLSKRVWRRIRDSLVAIGKIVVKGGSLTNARFEKERKARAEQIKKQAEAMRRRWAKERQNRETSEKFAKSLDEVSPKLSQNAGKKPNEINDDGHSQLHIVRERVRERKDTTLQRGRAKPDFDELQNKLLEACNGAAADPAASPGILIMSEPIKWIENGCDLELDILPTIKARSHKLRPGSVKNWSYFTQAIADAKASRERPMPKGEARQSRGYQTAEDRRRSVEDAWFERECAMAERDGLL